MLDLGTQELVRAGQAVALSPKALQLLGILVEHRPNALSKIDLQQRLWPNTFVVEKNLTNLIGEIRAALGDDPGQARFIRTVHRFGYAFRETAIEASNAGGEPRRHNLPIQVSSFIGRQRAIAELVRLLPSTRLLTLTGAGGCGKTRLALEVARQVLDGFPDGVWLADLAPLAEPALVMHTVAAVLDVRQAPNRSLVETLSDQLRHRRILLVLDNCEHVISTSAELAERLLHDAAGLTILATSREALQVAGETTWRVPSLTLPDPRLTSLSEDPAQCEAVHLLADRAAAVNSGFTVTKDNVSTVAEVCRRLDGIPLAIELAAARLNVLSIDQINARLDDRFRLLARAHRAPIGRQRTLEATVDWSYDLLSDAERHLLRRLSTFAGGWTLEAAEQVCSGDGIDRPDVLDVMSRLIDKSLVMADEEVDGRRRYRCLETVRQYAAERLRQSGEADVVRARHFECFLELARRAEPELTRADQLRWLERLQLEHDNVRVALEWCLASNRFGDQSLELALPLQWFWLKRAYLAEGQHWLERALARATAPSPARRAQALSALGNVLFFQGDFGRAMDHLKESAALAASAGEPAIAAFALGIRSFAASECGDLESAGRLAADSAAAARAAGAPELEVFSLSFFAYEALFAGDIDRAGQLHEKALALVRAQGELWGMGISLFDLSVLRVVQQRHTEARALCSEGIALGRQFGDRRAVAWCLGVLAGVEAAEGRTERAARLRGAMDGLLDSIGATAQPSFNMLIGDRYVGAVQRDLGTDAYEQAVAAGRAMSLPQAIDYAMEERTTGTAGT